MSDDTISRKATIDAIEGVDWYHIDSDGQLTHGANSEEHEPLYKAKDVYTVLNTMPSAQPETHDKRTETHACDLISRQAAIDAVDEALTRVFVEHRDVAEKVINKIPSAQPEVLACGEGELIAQPEIVRCKDCTFYRSDGCFFSTAEIEEDGFCSWAERKTDG